MRNQAMPERVFGSTSFHPLSGATLAFPGVRCADTSTDTDTDTDNAMGITPGPPNRHCRQVTTEVWTGPCFSAEAQETPNGIATLIRYPHWEIGARVGAPIFGSSSGLDITFHCRDDLRTQFEIPPCGSHGRRSG